jgi:FAD/FMN-containing dehydrogenase
MTEKPDRKERLDRFKAAASDLLGEKFVIADPDGKSPYEKEWRGRYQPKCAFVLRPGSTEEVSKILALANEYEVPVIPQGGNTGLVAGGVPFEGGDEVILSLGRMNKIRDLDPDNFTMTVEAGCVLQNLQEAAEEADRLFPLSLGAEGTCQIGGNLSTNAGGIHVIRYGNTRDLVLGLEVVLADGRIWNGLRGLRKDNTGYDMKHLFIGGEGTLGVITAAVLKLFPQPRETAVAFVAVPSPEAALTLLGRMRAGTGDAVKAFELIPRQALDFALEYVEGVKDPLESPSDWYVLTEITSGKKDSGIGEAMEEILAAAFEEEIVTDATIAASEGQAKELWYIREAIVEAQIPAGGSIKHDVSVPVSSVPAFLKEGLALVEKLVPGIRPVAFGHMGDGNIHFNLTQPEGADRDAYLARWDEVNDAVHDLVVKRFGGSISAEHGLGRMKVEENERFKSEIEIGMMRDLKKLFDPKGILNPGKVVRIPE